MKERIEKLLEEGLKQQNEMFVKEALNVLESEFRMICLTLLGEVTTCGISIKSMYSEIAGLQRPSWGCWNGFLLGLLKERRNILNTGTLNQRDVVNQADSLTWIAGSMEEPEEIKDDSFIDKLERLGGISRSKNRKGSMKARELMAIPIYIRNRIAHDNIQDNQWWTDAGYILNSLLKWYINSGITKGAVVTKKVEPWLFEDEGEVWCFNGINVKAGDSLVHYVSLSGKSRVDYERTSNVMLGFKRILGEEELQEANFNKLMNLMTPEELKGFFLGGYIVGEKAGEGGFAEVFKGTQLSTGRRVAIKILKPSLSDKDKLRFLNEAEYLSMFDHQNIAKIYEQNEQPWRKSQLYDLSEEKWFTDFKKSHGNILTYIAMEWIEGKTLDTLYKEIIQENRNWKENEVALWFAEAAEALEVIHNAHLIHRDISPKNIMITVNGTVKLMDFGISRTQFENRVELTSHGKMLGSEPYMSPEQLDYERAKSELGPRSDIYSLGATFYELFTRTYLYNHNNEADSIMTSSKRKINGERPMFPNLINKEISWAISTILMGCLENEQGDRYQNAQELKEDIHRYLNNIPIEYKEPGVIRRLNLLYKRNTSIINLSVVSFLLIALFTSIYIYSIKNAKDQLKLQLDLSTETLSKLIYDIPDKYEKELHSSNLYMKILGDNLNYLQNVDSILTNRNNSRNKEMKNVILNLEGIELTFIGRYQEAIVDFDKAIELDPKNFSTYYNKGISLYHLGKKKEAIVAYDKAIELNPKNFSLYANKGLTLYDLGKKEEAIVAYDKAIELDPKDSDTYYNKGLALYDLGKMEEAIISYDKAIELDPMDSAIYHNKGAALDKLGRYKEAIISYDKAIELDPKNSGIYYNKSLALDKLGRYKESIVVYDKAIKLNPNESKIYFNKGNTLFELGRYKEAIVVYDKAIKLDPKNLDAYIYKGNTLSELGRHKEAILVFDKAIELNPKNSDALIYKGYTLSDLKKFEEAIISFKKAIVLDCKNSDSYIGLALVYIENHQSNKAIETSLMGLKVDPNNLLMLINLAHGYLLDNQYNEAKKIYIKYKDEQVGNGKTFKQQVLDDFKELKKDGIQNSDMDRIEMLFKN